MSAQQPQHIKYRFSKTIALPYAEAVEKTRAALKEEGFGVLTENRHEGETERKA